MFQVGKRVPKSKGVQESLLITRGHRKGMFHTPKHEENYITVIFEVSILKYVCVCVLISFTIKIVGTKHLWVIQKNYLHIRIQYGKFYSHQVFYFTCKRKKNIFDHQCNETNTI